MSTRTRTIVSLGAFYGVTALAAAGGALATRSSVKTWYPTLRKPPFNPPSWLFGPVWSALYLAMSTAAWRVWRKRQDGADDDAVRRSTVLYGAQLALNSAWSILFFGLRSPAVALAEIGVLWTAIIAWYRSVVAVEPGSGKLILPYIGWTTFAAVLNGSIWWLNRDRR